MDVCPGSRDGGTQSTATHLTPHQLTLMLKPALTESRIKKNQTSGPTDSYAIDPPATRSLPAKVANCEAAAGGGG